MDPSIGKVLLYITFSLGVLAMCTRLWPWNRQKTSEEVLADISAPENLREHAKEFRKPEVIKVTDGVYVAIGYALANSIMLEAPEGIVIVDVTESYEAAQRIYEAFRNITMKPIKAIIYTHNHADHVYGAKAFIEHEAIQPDIWSHYSTVELLRRTVSTTNTIHYVRAMRQFGVFVPSHIRVSFGIGFQLKIDQTTMTLVMPNKFLYGTEKTVNIAGLDLELIHIPGETEDQIAVWLPQKRVLLPADDIYKAFPNLYAIRGVPTRDQLHWVDSLDRMRHLRAEYLVPSHTRPVEGEEKIFALLTDYRDAIQLIHDQTVRHINKGKYPDDIVELVQLPAQLKSHPYLQEFYGTVAWSVRGAFDGYMGWFSGDPVDLNPLPKLERAKNLVALAGDERKALSASKKALDDSEPQWALELASSVLKIDPSSDEARDLTVKCLKVLAMSQTSSNGRNYYLTCALEIAGAIQNRRNEKIQKDGIRHFPMKFLFQALMNKLKAEEVEGVDQICVFDFTDTAKQISLHIRNSILEVTDGERDNWTIKVKTTTTTWRSIMSKDRSALEAYTVGDLKIEGGLMSFREFMGHFET